MIALLQRLFKRKPGPYDSAMEDDAIELLRIAEREAKRFNKTVVDIDHLAVAFAQAYFRHERAHIDSKVTSGPDSVIIGRLPYSESHSELLDHLVTHASNRRLGPLDIWNGLFSCPVGQVRQAVERLELKKRWFTE